MKKDTDREHRIDNEAVVDTYGTEETAMGWYYYMEGKLSYPFEAKCVAKRSISPLLIGEEVKVCGMPKEKACLTEIFVMISWKKRQFAVPLSQLEAVGPVDEETFEAIGDWHYWVKRGYQY